MFNRESRPIIKESELADSVVESADSTADFTADPVKIDLKVRAFTPGAVSGFPQTPQIFVPMNFP